MRGVFAKLNARQPDRKQQSIPVQPILPLPVLKRTISSPEYHDRLINLVSANRDKLQELKRRASKDITLPIIIEDQPLLTSVMIPQKIDTQKNKTKISRRATIAIPKINPG